MNPGSPTLTRREQAEAYADLFDVPLADLYRRYGAVLLPGKVASGRALPTIQNRSGEGESETRGAAGV